MGVCLCVYVHIENHRSLSRARTSASSDLDGVFVTRLLSRGIKCTEETYGRRMVNL